MDEWTHQDSEQNAALKDQLEKIQVCLQEGPSRSELVRVSSSAISICSTEMKN